MYATNFTAISLVSDNVHIRVCVVLILLTGLWFWELIVPPNLPPTSHRMFLVPGLVWLDMPSWRSLVVRYGGEACGGNACGTSRPTHHLLFFGRLAIFGATHFWLVLRNVRLPLALVARCPIPKAVDHHLHPDSGCSVRPVDASLSLPLASVAVTVHIHRFTYSQFLRSNR